jgi:hypothetical protein
VWAAPFPEDAPLGLHLSAIDESSVPGDDPLSPRAPRQQVASVMSLWGRIVERRRTGMAHACAMDDIDCVPRDDGPPQAPLHPGSPVELWDRILSRCLAT